MRKLTYHVAITLDGFMAKSDDTYDCFVNEGPHVDDYQASLSTYDTVLMGRRTYAPALRVGVTDPYPALETFVFSRSLGKSPDPKVTVVADETAPFIRALKEKPGRGIYLCGGGQLASTLFEHGLIDEVLVKLNPVLLGMGIPVSPHLRSPKQLRLMSTKVYENGVLLVQYAVRQGVETG